jgi:glutaminyl-peptide cyclotransferase
LIPRVVARYPHDPTAWTEGLRFRDGLLYESTGKIGRSSIREIDLATGTVLRMKALPDDQFGEGFCFVERNLYQLTYKSGICHVWDAATLDHVTAHAYAGEGWGLAYDGAKLWQSDGSAALRIRCARTFEILEIRGITCQGHLVRGFNALEWLAGFVYANVHPTDAVVKINTATQQIVSVWDCAGLHVEGAEMNGIAYSGRGTFFLTGKLWPFVYEVVLD